MHLRGVCLLLATRAILASAYYSSGWSPDDTKTTAMSSPTPSTEGGAGATPEPAVTGSPFSFDWTDLIKKGPIGDLFKLAGINVTEHLEAAKQRAAVKPYDQRVPLITDENYESLIFDPVDGKDKTWFIVVSLGDTKDPVSNYFDEQYDKVFDMALLTKELPNIMWGRIDYMTVTRLTSEWMIWKAPVLVVARNNGQELRFLYPRQINLNPDNLHKFLKHNGWEEIPVWDGPFAPGGSLEKYVKIYAKYSTYLYNAIARVPKWLFLVASGAVASFIIQLMHSRGSSATTSTPKNNPKVQGATNGGVDEKEKAPTAGSGRPKRYIVKPVKEVHPELAQADMTSSITSTTSTASRPSMGTRSSTKKKPKK